jgi:hypothetical protein
MSTPVSQLPPATVAVPGNVRHDDDEIVADVINEMQNLNKPPAPAQVPAPQMPPVGHIVQQYVLPTYPPTKDLLFGVFDKTMVIRAVVAAIAALALFYAESLEEQYLKVPVLGVHLQTYDKLVRTLLLASLLYILMWKLEI